MADFVKSDGKYLGISFTESLVGDITRPVRIGEVKVDSIGASTVNSEAGAATNLIDGDIETMWISRYRYVSGQYITFGFTVGKAVKKLSLYRNSSYRPTGYIFYGSDDNTTWVTIGEASDDSSTGWITLEFIDNNAKYKFYKLSFTGYTNSYYIMIGELIVYSNIYNDGAFTITGNIYDGRIKEKVFAVKSVSRHPTVDNAILLEINDTDRFESVIGNLTLRYDRNKGNLRGLGGPIEQFEMIFLPTDLIWKKHPNILEHVEVSNATINGQLKEITIINCFDLEHIDVSDIIVNGSLTRIEDI